MTQEERWEANWKAVMDFMEANKRRPSKFVDEERGMRNLVEASAEVGECWGVERREDREVQGAIGDGRKV